MNTITTTTPPTPPTPTTIAASTTHHVEDMIRNRRPSTKVNDPSSLVTRTKNIHYDTNTTTTKKKTNHDDCHHVVVQKQRNTKKKRRLVSMTWMSSRRTTTSWVVSRIIYLYLLAIILVVVLWKIQINTHISMTNTPPLLVVSDASLLSSSSSSSLRHIHTKQQSQPEKFLLATYHYKSQFNDKRTSWLPAIMNLAIELNRTLVLPSFNVRFPSREKPPSYGSVGRSSSQWFQPFQDFFNTSIYQPKEDQYQGNNDTTIPYHHRQIKVITIQKYREIYGYDMDVHIIRQSKAQHMLQVQCPQDDDFSKMEDIPPTRFSRYGYDWSSRSILCFPDVRPPPLRMPLLTTKSKKTANIQHKVQDIQDQSDAEYQHLQLLEEAHILLDGFDNHDGDYRISIPLPSPPPNSKVKYPKRPKVPKVPLVFRNELYQEAARFRQEHGLDTCSTLLSHSSGETSYSSRSSSSTVHLHRVDDHPPYYAHPSETSMCSSPFTDTDTHTGSSFAYVSIVWRRFKWQTGGGKSFPPQSVVDAAQELVQTYYPHGLSSNSNNIINSQEQQPQQQLYPLFLATDCDKEEELEYIRQQVKPMGFRVIQYTLDDSPDSFSEAFAQNPGYAALIDQILAAGAEISATSPGSTFSNVVDQLRLEARRRPPLKLELVDTVKAKQS